MKYGLYNFSFISLLLLCGILFTEYSAFAAWGDLLEIFTDKNDSSTENKQPLSNSEVVDGLKEALAKGTQTAVKKLGRVDGFFRNPNVKIPMPDSLKTVEKTLRKFKQDKIADEFILTMNRAAERAVPEATRIFAKAIQDMTFEDARKILRGPDNAATQYFRRTSSDDLTTKMLPVIQQATNDVGVTAKYKSMVDKLGFAGNLIDEKSLDLDQYVTNKAIDGLFKLMADEERLIRRDPASRTTELLKKVFH